MPWVGVAERRSRPPSSRSTRRTPAAGLGPSLRIVAVKVTEEPATTEAGLAAMVAASTE